MGWANASYLPAIIDFLPNEIAHGKQATKYLNKDAHMSSDARTALRRYSTSEYAGIEDGSTLNASLIAGDDTHRQWAESMDEAFVWSFSKPVLLWRGGLIDSSEEGSPCFVSTSLVERKARQFRSRGIATLTAMVLPERTPVAIPAMVWGPGDNERTLGVVGREVEVILPRGVTFSPKSMINPFHSREPDYPLKLSIVEAVAPSHRRTFKF